MPKLNRSFGFYTPPLSPPLAGRGTGLFGTFLFFFILVGPLLALETTIEGGKMELLQKGEKVLFKEGVRLKRGRDRLKAQQMTTNKNRDKVKAQGKVQFLRYMNDKEKVEGYGREGFYNTNEGKGYLLGGIRRAHVIFYQTLSSTETRRVDLYAKRIDFLKETSNAIAKKKVYGTTIDPRSGEKYEFWAEQAEYFGADKKIVLTGKKKPRVLQTLDKDEKHISGETIIYYIEPQRLIADGQAKAIFIEPEKEKTEKK